MPQDNIGGNISLTPVDHDPNDYALLTPVDHDPWLDAPNTLQETTKLKSGLKAGESTSKQAEDVSEAVPRNIASGTVPADTSVMPLRMRTLTGAMTGGLESLYDPVRSFGTVMQPIVPTGPRDMQGNPTWSDADEARAQATAAHAESEVGKAARAFVFGGAAASNLAAAAGLGAPTGVGVAGSPVERPSITVRPRAFYSQLEDVIKDGPNAASPEQWKATLESRTTKEERQYTGVDQFLDEQKGPVTKQALQQHAKDNAVQVGEIVKHELGVGEDNGETKYRGYTLPGGENYKEMLLTLPERTNTPPNFERWAKYHGYPDLSEARIAELRKEYTERVSRGDPTFGFTNNFTSPHWDERNVLGHIRFDDRTVNGDRALHIAEAQSDWHQKGRTEGYIQHHQVVEDPNGGFRIRLPDGRVVGQGPMNLISLRLSNEEHPAWPTRELAQKAATEADKRLAVNQVPDAPFKTSWPDLLMKRMLHYAAEHGYDRLSWDTGATNAERYDLSHKLDRIEYSKEADGRWHISPYSKDDPTTVLPVDVPRKFSTPEEIERVYGKDIADKVSKDVGEAPSRVTRFNKDSKILRGDNLKIGGEGMHAFYDRMLPNAVNKLVKKYGAKVEQGSTTVPGEFHGGISGEQAMELLNDAGVGRHYGIPEMPRERTRFWRDLDQNDRDLIFINARAIKGQQAGEDDIGVHSVKITPELRNAALSKGFKLFTGSDEGGGALTGFVARGLSPSGAKLATARNIANAAGSAEAAGVERGAVPGGVGRTPSLEAAQAEAHGASGGRIPLTGLPTEGFTLAGEPYVPGPIGYLHDIAEDYMRQSQLPYHPPSSYAKIDPVRAARIAKAYGDMPHAPNDPEVAAAYDAMANETLAQYRAIKAAGLKFEFIRPGMEDPYGESPRMAARDVIRNKHLWVFPTEEGFGTESTITDNPLLKQSGEVVDGKPATVNDIFRIVHDVFGHLKDGNGFRAAGEENAWRSHSAMYSDLARKAMTSETRGQNSFVNYGPHGEFNRTASGRDTIYGDQKSGVLPQWVIEEGRRDPFPAGAEPIDLEHARAPYSNLIGQTRSNYLTPQGSPIKSKTFSKAADEAWAKVETLSKGDGPLDLSLSQQMPNVPQVPIQRIVPPRGISPRMVDAMRDPKIAEGVAKSIQAGMKDGIHFWYHTEAIRKAFQDVWGDRWEKPFKLFMDTQAAASPKSDVPTQIRNGTWLYHHGINGRELPPKGPDIYPYGHLGANLHRQNFATIMGLGWDVLKNPKPPSFSANLQGNLEPGTIDTHAMRNIGMRTGDPRWLATTVSEILKPGKQPSNWQAMFGEIGKLKANGERIVTFRPQQLVRSGRLTMQEALDRGPMWDSVPRPNEYAAMEDFYRKMGNNFNLPTAGAQAAAWAGAGPLTGLGTVSDMTFTQLMNERIMYTAFMRGESPWKVLRDMVLGNKPLLGLAGAGMLAPRLFGDNKDKHQ